MDLATIEVSKPEARKAFLEYKRAVEKRHDAEDEAIMRGYRELARGRQVIRLSEVITDGGFTDHAFKSSWSPRTSYKVALPNLAVCRADERWASISAQRGSITFVGFKNDDDAWHRSTKRRVRTGVQVPLPDDRYVSDRQFRAMVPITPPPLRPAHHLRNYHVLFEAEWTQYQPPAPRDPALLKHMGGDLYAVLAVWDLTELERAVLSGRR